MVTQVQILEAVCISICAKKGTNQTILHPDMADWVLYLLLGN